MHFGDVTGDDAGKDRAAGTCIHVLWVRRLRQPLVEWKCGGRHDEGIEPVETIRSALPGPEDCYLFEDNRPAVTMLRRASVWVFGQDGDILTNSATQALIVASSVLVTGTMLLSPLIADLATVFAVSEARAGWLIVGFTAAATASLPLVGVFATRIGRKSVLVAGLLLFGVGGAAVGVVPWFEAALALRVVQGTGYAAGMTVILTMFGDLYSGSRETTVQGMRVSLNSVVNTAVPLLAGGLFVYSWRYPFAIYLLAVPAALWIWVSVPTVEATDSWSVRTYLRDLATFLSDALIALLLASFLLRFVVYYGALTYFSVLAVREVGLAVVAVGFLLSIRSLVKTISSTQAGRLSLSYDPSVLALAGFLLLGGGTFLMGIMPTTVALFVAVLVWGAGDGILSPCQKSLVNRLSPSEYRDGAMSAALVFQNAGKVIGPAAVGVLLGAVDPARAFVLLGFFCGSSGVGSLLGVVVLQRSSELAG